MYNSIKDGLKIAILDHYCDPRYPGLALRFILEKKQSRSTLYTDKGTFKANPVRNNDSTIYSVLI